MKKLKFQCQNWVFGDVTSYGLMYGNNHIGDVTPYSLIIRYLHFGGICCLRFMVTAMMCSFRDQRREPTKKLKWVLEEGVYVEN
jgi:hypothetical protein